MAPPIRLLSTQEDLGDYNAAVVAQQQLEEAGFTVELEVTDEATLDENLEDDDRWDITTNAYVFRPDPVLIAAFASCTADGQWCTDDEARGDRAAADRVNLRGAVRGVRGTPATLVSEAPAIKLVNNYGIAALSSKVKNLIETTHFEIEPEFANCWLEEE